MGTVERARSIGLTGNIASGKSSVARHLAGKGAHLIDADAVAHTLMRPGLPAWRDVVEHFGKDILGPDRAIDRAALRTIVFSDAAALRRLNEAVHPHVHRELLRRLTLLVPGTVAVIEAVALIEAGTYRDMDAVWLILCPPELQVARLVAERRLAPEDAAWRVAAQPPAESKAALADVVIHNDGSLEQLFAAADRAWTAALVGWGLHREEARQV